MSELKARVLEDIKAAMRAGDKPRVSVLRMLSAELKQREVVEAKQMNDALVITAIEKMIKQRRDAEAQYRNGNRPELADKEAAEVGVLSGYLPKQLDPAELIELIQQAISQTGAQGMRDMGKVMAWIKPKAAGKADMGKLSGLIKSKLS
ncbi:MAG: GatB/YqeY domain-containing protein [Panacagrimonas sp.]